MSLIRKIVGRPTETETAGPTENLSGPVERDASTNGWYDDRNCAKCGAIQFGL